MKKLSNTEAELKKSVAYKKKRVHNSQDNSNLTFTCSNSTMETPEKVVKYVQS